MVKNLPAMLETGVQSLSWEDPLEEAWQPILVFSPVEFCGWRSLVGCIPRGCKESDMTERQIFSLVSNDEGVSDRRVKYGG